MIKKELEGIDLFCVVGDLGINSSIFEFHSKEGVYFLANGIGDDLSKDKMLVISNHNSVISWEFIPVDSLIDLF